MLTQAQHQAIREAVAKAERHTTGEIFCIVARASGHYREVPFAWAAAVALAGPPLAMALGLRPAALLAVLQSDWVAAHTAGLDSALTAVLVGYAALQAALFVLVAALASLPAVKAVLTPASLKRAHVHQRAMEQFFAQGLQATAERTGVLIFVSQAERRIEIIADEGIHAKVGTKAWDKAVAAAIQRIRAGDAAGGLLAAIAVCGDVLAEHFPSDGETANQLSDDVLEI
jgi:putative membrane protein